MGWEFLPAALQRMRWIHGRPRLLVTSGRLGSPVGITSPSRGCFGCIAAEIKLSSTGKSPLKTCKSNAKSGHRKQRAKKRSDGCFGLNLGSWMSLIDRWETVQIPHVLGPFSNNASDYQYVSFSCRVRKTHTEKGRVAMPHTPSESPRSGNWAGLLLAGRPASFRQPGPPSLSASPASRFPHGGAEPRFAVPRAPM